jgi:hypothetical protein
MRNGKTNARFQNKQAAKGFRNAQKFGGVDVRVSIPQIQEMQRDNKIWEACHREPMYGTRSK